MAWHACHLPKARRATSRPALKHQLIQSLSCTRSILQFDERIPTQNDTTERLPEVGISTVPKLRTKLPIWLFLDFLVPQSWSLVQVAYILPRAGVDLATAFSWSIDIYRC
jgi:hypothetical protein